MVKWFDKVEDNNDKFFALSLIDFSEGILTSKRKITSDKKIIDIDGEIDTKLRLKLSQDLDNFKFKTKNYFKDKHAIIRIPDNCEISKVFESGNLDKKEILVSLCGISEEQDFMRGHTISGDIKDASSFKVKAAVYTSDNQAFSSIDDILESEGEQINGFYADIPIDWIQSIENNENKMEKANLCSFSKKENHKEIKNFIDKKFNNIKESKPRNSLKR